MFITLIPIISIFLIFIAIIIIKGMLSRNENGNTSKTELHHNLDQQGADMQMQQAAMINSSTNMMESLNQATNSIDQIHQHNTL